jgi:hypothetical protein
VRAYGRNLGTGRGECMASASERAGRLSAISTVQVHSRRMFRGYLCRHLPHARGACQTVCGAASSRSSSRRIAINC